MYKPFCRGSVFLAVAQGCEAELFAWDFQAILLKLHGEHHDSMVIACDFRKVNRGFEYTRKVNGSDRKGHFT